MSPTAEIFVADRTGRGKAACRPEGSTLTRIPTREERFNQLYDDHFEAVRRYVWRRDPSLCDDVLAETFLVAWRRLDEMPRDARPWLIGVARNVRLNVRRSARRQHALSNHLIETAPDPGRSDAPREAAAVRAALSRQIARCSCFRSGTTSTEAPSRKCWAARNRTSVFASTVPADASQQRSLSCPPTVAALLVLP